MSIELAKCHTTYLLKYYKTKNGIPVPNNSIKAPSNDENSSVKKVMMDSRTGIYIDRQNAYYIAPGTKKEGSYFNGHMVGKLKRNAEEEIVSIRYFDNVPAEIKKDLDTRIKNAKKQQNPLLSC